ncbi:MAG: hypothetical protein OXC48_07090 [Endozoicomonadaceae bacterium]|nr:hypothetical protein [Endozoicomonadaceae bacterium]
MVVGSLAAVVDIAAIPVDAVFEGLQGAFFADGAASMDMSARDAANISEHTYNTLTKELADFTKQKGKAFNLKIPDNETFKAVWNKIVNIGIGVKNNTDKLFLLLAQLRSTRGQEWSLEWLADYLNAKEYGVGARPYFPTIVNQERFFTETPYLDELDHFDALDNMEKDNQFLIHASETHPYYTYGSKVGDDEWELIHVDQNNQISSEILNEDEAFDFIKDKNTYRFRD